MKSHTTTRRRLLASLPAAAAAMTPVAATALSGLHTGQAAHDPMFAAVARHRKAWRAYDAACDRAAQMEDSCGREAKEALRAADEAGEVNEVMIEAAEALSNTSATTVAGVVAVLEYFAELSAADELDPLFEPFVGHTEIHADFLHRLADTLRSIA